jgi:hypothetical protein
VQEITGQITGGSINVDGMSALRRTCSINMVGNNLNYYSALHNKFKLEIGVKNTIDTNHPEIIWFPQGIFVCTSWNVSTSLTHQTVSIQGQDKMCLLNGTVSGALPHAVNFGELEIYDGDEVIFENVHIKDILKNAIYTYGNEKLENIIITDIENYGLELLQYRGTDTLYAFINAESQEADNIYFGT